MKNIPDLNEFCLRAIAISVIKQYRQRLKHIAEIIALLLLIPPIMFAQNFWQQTNGPYAGNIYSLVVNSSGHVFAGTYGGGIFRSTDGGNNWNQINNGLSGFGWNRQSVSLAINSDGILYAAAGRVYRSVDNGDSWSAIDSDLPSNSAVCVIVGATGQIYVGTSDKGVFRSRNNGGNWIAANKGASNANIISLAVNTAGHIFAAVYLDGIYRTVDSGATWIQVQQKISAGNTTGLAINSFGHIFAAINGAGIYRSMNNGDSWTDLSYYNCTSAIFINSSGHIITAKARSINNGASWMDMQGVPSFIKCFGEQSSGILYAGSEDAGVLKSIDNGNSWQKSNNGLKNSYVTSLLAIGSGAILAGDQHDGLFSSTNAGNEWKRVAEGYVASLCRDSAGIVYLGGFSTISRSLDNGLTWKPLFASGWQSSIAVNTQGHVFTGTNNGLYRSTNNGDTWVELSNGLTTRNIFALSINSSGHIFAGTAGGGIYRSTSNGNSWQQSNSGLGQSMIQSVFCEPSGRIFVGTQSAGIFYSTNNGDSWTQSLSGQTVHGFAMNSSGHLFAAASDGVVRSRDSGVTWQKFYQSPSSEPWMWAKSLLVDSLGFLYVGTNYDGVLRSAKTTITPLVPILASPANGSIDLSKNFTLTWYPSNAAESYCLQVAKDSLFTQLLVDQSAIATTSKGVSLQFSTTYYWRVRAENENGLSAWSPFRRFTTVEGPILGEYTPDANTVLLMHLNETSGNTVKDVSENKYMGTFGAGSFVPGRFGNAFQPSDSAGIVIQSFSTFDLGNQFTVEAWIRLSSFPSSGVDILMLGRNNSINFYIIPDLRLRLYLYFSNGTQGDLLTNQPMISLGVWHHVAVTFNNGLVSIYINGELKERNNYYPSVQKTIGTSYIAGTFYNSEMYHGLIDEIRVSKIARDPSEFNLQRPPQNLTSTANANSLQLIWQNGGGAAPLMRYKIYRGIDSLNLTFIDSTMSTSYTDTKITLGSPYFYRVSAVDSTGFEGAKSYVTRAATSLFGEYQPDANTVVLLHLNEERGVIANDASNFKNDGTFNKSSVFIGRFGRGRKFDAQSSITIPYSSSVKIGGSDFTIEGWIKTDTPSDSWGWRFFSNYDGIKGLYIDIRQIGLPVLGLIDAAGKQVEVNGVRQIDDLKWHHLVVRRIGFQMTLFVDGILESGIDISSMGSFSTNATITLGAVGVANRTDYFIDEIRISNLARSSGEFNLQLPPVNISATSVSSTVNLSWQNGGGAVPLMRYKIYRGTDSMNVTLIDSTVNTSYTNSGLTTGTTYYYRVGAVDSTGFEGAKSYAVRVQPPIPGPTLSSPVNGSSNLATTTTLTWNPFVGASVYQVQVSGDSLFRSTFFMNDSTISAVTKTASGLIKSISYYWRVRAKTTSGWSLYSNTWNFQIAPTSITPPVTQGMWQQTNGPYGSCGILSLAVNSSNHLFAATEEGIYRSINNGQTWTPINNGMTSFGEAGPRCVALAMTPKGDLFAAWYSVYRSTDNGDSWSQHSSGLDGPVACFLTTVDGTVFAGRDKGAFRLVQGSNTWSAVNAGITNLNIRSMVQSTDGTLFAGAMNGEIFRSTNNGDNWNQLSTGIPSLEIRSLAVDSSGSVYAGTLRGPVYKSTNNGTTWTSLGIEGETTAILVNRENQVFVGGGGGSNHGLSRSTDGGSTWVFIQNGILREIVQSLALTPSGNLVAGTYSGVFLPTSNGDSWKKINNGIKNSRIFSMFPTSSGSILAAVLNTGIHSTTDAGLTWVEQKDIPYYIAGQFVKNSLGHIFLSDRNSGVYRSTDDGRTWTSINAGLTQQVWAIAVGRYDHLYAGTSSGVFRSTNNGDSWTQKSNGLPAEVAHVITALPSGQLFIGTASSHLYRSDNNGETWIQSDAGISGRMVFCFYTDFSGTLYAGTNQGDSLGVYRSTDNGANWLRISGNTFISAVNTISQNASGHFFVGSDNIYRSIDKGMTWSRGSWTTKPTGLYGYVTSLFFDSLGYGYAGTERSGVFRTSKTTVVPSVPLLIAPNNLASDLPKTITLSWSDSYAADSYWYQVAKDSLFTQLIVDQSLIATTSKQVALQSSTTYYWRVRAENENGLSGWSLFRRFTTVEGPILGEYTTDANTVLLMHMNETSGNTVKDSSIFKNNGTAIGTTITAGRFGKARQFNGLTDYLTIPHRTSINYAGALTIEAWILANQFVNNAGIITKGTSNRSYSLHEYNQSIAFSTASNTYRANSTLVPGKYQHVAVVIVETILKFYINGVLDKQENLQASITNNAEDLTIGVEKPGTPEYWNGIIDEIRISMVTRSPEEFNLQLPPKNLELDITGTLATLTWQKGGGLTPVMRYKIYRGLDSMNVALIDSTDAPLYANSGLAIGTKYYYRVSAVDSTGFEGAWSYAATVTAQPKSIKAISGGNQSGKVTTTLPSPFVVTVLDNSNSPVPTISVAFTIVQYPAGATGQSLSRSSALTDSLGQASTLLTLGDKRGTYRINCVPVGWKGDTAWFSAVATPGTASLLAKISGDNQSALIKFQIKESLVIIVRDDKGNEVPNANVQFSILQQPTGAAGALCFPISAQTDSNGRASTTVTMGSKAGNYTITASSQGLTSINFTAKGVYLSDFNADGRVNGQDLTLLLTYKQQNNLTLGDIGPAAGTVPELLPIKDVKIDFEDAMVFGQMWNWSLDNPNPFGSITVSDESNPVGTLKLNCREDPSTLSQTSREISFSFGTAVSYRGVSLRLEYNPQSIHVEDWSYPSDNTLFALKRIENEKGFAVLDLAHYNSVLNKQILSGEMIKVRLKILNGSHNARLAIHAEAYTETASLAGKTQTEYAFNNEQIVPREFALNQNYPNPFNPSTIIRYSLPVKSQVRLIILNTLGQRIATLVNSEQAAGNFQVEWKTNMATGLYFYRLEAVGVEGEKKAFSSTKKMLLLQ
ncbi:MAG: LamG-like jellyroll fold domain-containing protein [bacterium]